MVHLRFHLVGVHLVSGPLQRRGDAPKHAWRTCSTFAVGVVEGVLDHSHSLDPGVGLGMRSRGLEQAVGGLCQTSCAQLVGERRPARLAGAAQGEAGGVAEAGDGL